MTLRNLVLIVLLTLFFGWYACNWAYKTQYRAPRETLTKQIGELSQAIESGDVGLAAMRQFNEQTEQTYWLYPRSLPPTPNHARQYSFLLLEMLQFCGLENANVQEHPPSRVPSGAEYRFYAECTGTLSQFSHFLFEFYYAPFLHRITTLTLMPIDGDANRLTFSMTINALALNAQHSPYPVTNQLPGGWRFPRLAFDNLAAYQVIEERNLLQAARGGIDQADFTFLTGLLQIDNQTEVVFSVRTDDSTIKLKQGDTIRSGSFVGKIVEVYYQDIVLDRDGSRWLLSLNESLDQAFALPPETAP